MAIARNLDAWKRYSYRKAATGLEELPIATWHSPKERLRLAWTLSKIFASWDDFNFEGALKHANGFKAQVAEYFPNALGTLKLLSKSNSPKAEAASIFDLWHNVLRRASNGRYDDVTARVYRLIEWTAQWQLKLHHGWSTADFPADKMPEARLGPDGKISIGLVDSWKAVRDHIKGKSVSSRTSTLTKSPI